MSKLNDHKAKVGYVDKAIPNTCANCCRMTFTLELPAWMKEHNERVANGTVSSWANGGKVYGPEHRQEKNLRCNYAGMNFAVKKLAVCNLHSKGEPQEVTA